MSISESPHEIATNYVAPVLLGAFLNAMMSGILIIQVSSYFARYKNDSIRLKYLVAFSGAMTHVTCALAASYAYRRAIFGFGGPKQVPMRIVEMTTFMVTPALQAAIVQLFFGWRASRFIESNGFFKVVVVSALAQIGSGLAAIFGWCSTIPFHVPVPFCIIRTGLTFLTELSISLILVYHLVKRRRGHADVDDLLGKVMRLTLQTGFLSTSWELVSLVLFLTEQDTVCNMLLIAQPPLLANNLLAALNCRLSTNATGKNLGGTTSPAPISGINARNAMSEVTFMSLGIKSDPSTATGTTGTGSGERYWG